MAIGPAQALHLSQECVIARDADQGEAGDPEAGPAEAPPPGTKKNGKAKKKA